MVDPLPLRSTRLRLSFLVQLKKSPSDIQHNPKFGLNWSLDLEAAVASWRQIPTPWHRGRRDVGLGSFGEIRISLFGERGARTIECRPAQSLTLLASKYHHPSKTPITPYPTRMKLRSPSSPVPKFPAPVQNG